MRSFVLPLLLALAPSAFVGCAPVEEDDADDGSAAVSSADVKDIGHALDGVTNAAVLAKNEDALAAKLAVVDGAKSGDTLDVSYYIFSDDESSALYATRLVEAAKRGVKVRVMLDYLTNLTRYHYFKAMQDAAGGPSKMEFRFYNKPNDNIYSDVRFLVTPCTIADKPITDPACTADRRAKSSSPESAANARLFLTGLYSKSSAALQISMGAVIQQYQAAATAGGTTKPEDRAKALEAFKLVFDAKVKGDVSAALLVFLAGDKLAPIHNVWSALIPEAGDAHKRDWQHLSDFTHQKITLATHADGSADMVTGGRNVENSYHLSELPAEREGAWKKKYIFMDMDSKASFRNGAKVKSRFETVWGFDGMVAKMNGEVEKLTPVDLQIPVLENGRPTGATVPVLKAYTYAEIEATAARFAKEYATYDGKGALAIKFRGKALDLADSQFPHFDITDPNAKFYYFDNVHNPNGSRVYGTDIAFGEEKSAGKQIQELWFRAVATACAKGDGDKKPGQKVEIIFHNAYLSLPGRLQHQLFDRTNLYGQGTRFECENGVSQVKIITNSRESTDLNVVNVYNEPWMKPTLEADREHEGGKRFIQYREYNTQKITAKNPISRSLHAKVMIFGNDIFIGSANADGRSQFMDTNNGVLVTNAPKLVKAYKTWLAETVESDFLDPNEDPRGLRSKTVEQIAKENADFMAAGLKAKGQSDLVIGTTQKRITADTLKVYETAKTCVPAYDKACISNMDQVLQVF
jgi:cardiolipin synthase C